MQAAHCVSWEPLSEQDMGLVWRPQSMHNHKKVITSLFRESLCVRMRISSLVRTPDSARSRVGLKSALCPALDSIFAMGGPQRLRVVSQDYRCTDSRGSEGQVTPVTAWLED